MGPNPRGAERGDSSSRSHQNTSRRAERPPRREPQVYSGRGPQTGLTKPGLLIDMGYRASSQDARSPGAGATELARRLAGLRRTLLPSVPTRLAC